MKPLVPLLLTVFIVSCGPGSRSVEVRQSVHPVLIRNPHNALLQLILQGTGSEDSFEFVIEGDRDLDRLEMFYTGDKTEFAADHPFGEAAPAQRVTIRGKQELKPGPNVFWLTCRVAPNADLSHRVFAKYLGAPNTTPLAHRIGVALRRHNDDGVHTYRIPALATGTKRELYAVYDMRRRKSRDLQEDIDIGLSRSLDGGKTWEPPRVIMDMGQYGNKPQEENGVSDPGIIVDEKTGEIFVWAVWMWGKPGKHQWTGDGSEPGFEIGKSAQMMVVRSRDAGVTWTKPENLTRKLKKAEWWLLAPSPQQGINLKDGTLVMPVQGRDEKGVPFATIMVSGDHGASWTVGTPAFSGGNECQAAQLADGSIMLNMRNDHERFRAVYVTSDLGKTWKEHATNRNTLIEPNCNASLRRILARNLLLFSNPHSQKARTHQTIQVSLDDGRTWPEGNHLLLDEGRGRGYSSMSQVDDGHIGIVYEGSTADLVYEKIGLEELVK
ncbi:MAG: exo-alpha-sialidase [Bryobacteraceae bacterium]